VTHGYYGVYVDVYEPEGEYSLIDSVITDTGYVGMYICDLAGTGLVSGTRISGSGTDDPAAGLEIYPYGGTPLTIRNSSISNNLFGGITGEVYDDGTTLEIIDSTVAGNGDVGLDLRFSEGSRMTVTGSTFSGNLEGGLWAYLYDESSASVANSTVSGNLAGSEGWALWAGGDTTGDFAVSHTTVTDNQGIVGLGIEDIIATVTHSIIAGNDITGSFGEFWVEASGTVDVTVDWSLIGGLNDETGGTGYAQGVGVTTGVTDPGLEPLADNGGPTLTHLLTLSSPAYNAGNPAIAGAPAVDQRGGARIVGAAIDLGAVEIVPLLPATGVESAPVALTGGLLLLLGMLVAAGGVVRRRVAV